MNLKEKVGNLSRRTRIAVGSGAGAIATVALLVLLAFPASGSPVSLTASNWIAGCTNQASGSATNTMIGTTGHDFSSTPTVATGFTSYSGTVMAAAMNATNHTPLSHYSVLATGQHFDLGAKSTGGCYKPSTNHTINVLYNWTIQGAGWMDISCNWGPAVVSWASINVTILGDLHMNNSPYYMLTSHQAAWPHSLTANNSATCSTGKESVLELTNTHAQRYSVWANGSVFVGKTYDFFTSIAVTLSAGITGTGGATAAGDSAFAAYNETATLNSIYCSNC
jgi:hypothetical protein